ncbi:unnamed protein product (macronuclear) [Paramecium tetraurelia]|uniref:Uncharacterized protein n=1 Tax=Paramecium tetraurelia TaxID=5888 RepID=A0CDP4_PARTE|nr:uncharacterized protein GSPATT00007123001 [Paramecium tetraurelia]CAK68911.1 unnamed protein product [Paramecium tetraurelia]|eukprot:XP_001436308.1 hypothetical protein (macronuclear) [Paramecium tetraurelia strain d4-2]
MILQQDLEEDQKRQVYEQLGDNPTDVDIKYVSYLRNIPLLTIKQWLDEREGLEVQIEIQPEEEKDIEVITQKKVKQQRFQNLQVKEEGISKQHASELQKKKNKTSESKDKGKQHKKKESNKSNLANKKIQKLNSKTSNISNHQSQDKKQSDNSSKNQNQKYQNKFFLLKQFDQIQQNLAEVVQNNIQLNQPQQEKPENQNHKQNDQLAKIRTGTLQQIKQTEQVSKPLRICIQNQDSIQKQTQQKIQSNTQSNDNKLNNSSTQSNQNSQAASTTQPNLQSQQQLRKDQANTTKSSNASQPSNQLKQPQTHHQKKEKIKHIIVLDDDFNLSSSNNNHKKQGTQPKQIGKDSNQQKQVTNINQKLTNKDQNSFDQKNNIANSSQQIATQISKQIPINKNQKDNIDQKQKSPHDQEQNYENEQKQLQKELGIISKSSQQQQSQQELSKQTTIIEPFNCSNQPVEQIQSSIIANQYLQQQNLNETQDKICIQQIVEQGLSQNQEQNDISEVHSNIQSQRFTSINSQQSHLLCSNNQNLLTPQKSQNIDYLINKQASVTSELSLIQQQLNQALHQPNSINHEVKQQYYGSQEMMSLLNQHSQTLTQVVSMLSTIGNFQFSLMERLNLVYNSVNNR